MNPCEPAALDYAARGWPVLPLHSILDGRCTCDKLDCDSPAKHPWTPHGLKDATTDPSTIASWWRTKPNANVGMVTGTPSGRIVIDVDPRHGGDVGLEDLLVQHGSLPETVEALTGGGGRHIHLKHPGGEVKNIPDGKLAPGVGLKADGGYVVAPPSLHYTGNRYQWELSSDPGEVPLADAPAWLLALLAQLQDPPAPAAVAPQGGRIVDGKRNATLASLAGSMRRRGMTEAAILAALQADNRARCDPPLSDDKVAAIAKSIGRYPPAAPRTPATDDPARTAPPQWRPFPVEALPPACRSFVRELAEATGTDPSLGALAVLVAMAGAIGNTRRVRVKSDWIAPAVIWGAIIMESGGLKTVVLKHVLAPVFRRQAEAFKAHRAASDEYKRAVRVYKREMKELESSGREADAPVEPIRPVPERCVVSDATVEALADRLQDAPRGLLLARDELSGWLRSFNQYRSGRGADEAHWVEMYEAGSLLVDRKVGDKATIHVPHAAVSIIGGIQPDILRRALRPEYHECGLAARLLMTMPPRRAKRWVEHELAAAAVKRLADVCARLWSLAPVLQDGESRPLDLPLSADAKALFAAFVNQHGQEALALTGDLAAAWAKLEGYVPRLALVLELASWAEDPQGDGLGPAEVSAASVRAALQIIEWAKAETQRIYSMLGETEEEEEVREVVALIERQDGRITAYDLHKSMPKRFPESDDADQYLAGLVPLVGHWVDVPPGPKGGRPTRLFTLHCAPVQAPPETGNP